MSCLRPEETITPERAKECLIEGNRRFVKGEPAPKNTGEARRKELLEKGQRPFAAVLCCSDSRVPPEIVFDQALGDIFVVRVAGNVLDDAALGSLEYAVEHLRVPLVVVLGHEKCGAVQAAVGGGEAPGKIGSIVEKICPHIERVRSGGAAGDFAELVTDENIRAAVMAVKESPVIGHFVREGTTEVVGAKYLLASGEVIFW